MSDASLNELEALVRRAVRGTGRPWGLAEDAAWAVRWLEARGLPGARLIDRWLEAPSPAPGDDTAPLQIRGTWRAHQGRLCPFAIGPALADHAAAEALLEATAYPLLVAPFAANVALAARRSLELSWEGALVALAVDGEGWRAEGPALEAAEVPSVSLHPATAAVQPGKRRPRRPRLPAPLWQRLEALAARTYVPSGPAGATGG